MSIVRKYGFQVSLYLLFTATLSIAATANCAEFKGCKVRTEGINVSLLPDVVQNAKLISGTTLKPAIADSALHSNFNLSSELNAGDGIVFVCRCKTRDSNPVSVLALLEFRPRGKSYVFHSGLIRQQIYESYKDKEVMSVVELRENEIQYAKNSSIYSQPVFGKNVKPKKIQILGTGHARRSTNPKSAASVSFYVEWSLVGQNPSSSEIGTPYWGNQCL